MNWNKHKELYIGIASIAFTLVLWEAVVRLGFIPELFVSRPSKIFLEGVKIFHSGTIFSDFGASITVFLSGYLLAVFFGVTFGIVLGFYKNVFSLVKAHVFILSSLPLMALMPLITMWAGIGLPSRVVFVFLMAFVPILINTIDGVHNVDEKKIAMARAFCAKDIFVLRSVVFFDALPFIFSGMRSAIGRGFMGLIVSEFFGYGKGLGYLISYYGNTLQTGRYMVVLFIVSALSLTMVKIIGIFEKRIIFWNKK